VHNALSFAASLHKWSGIFTALQKVHVISCLDLSCSAGDNAEDKQDAAVVAADDSRRAPANKRTNKKSVAAARKAAADKVTDVGNSPVSVAGKPDAKQKSSALHIVDLLTPVDLIKKSSANRAKQKQAPAQNQQPTSEAAPCDPAETEPAGKKVATRGRNANLQVVEVEPKAKRGKRKAASETTDKLTADVTAAQAPASLEQDQEDFLPNRKRARPSKSLPHKAGATVGPDTAVAELQQPEAGEAGSLREVPGLPGVKHQMPKIAAATAATKDARPAQLAAEAAASESRTQSGPARSNNSRKQASSGKAGTSKAAATGETAKPATVSAQQPGCAEGEVAVDKPGDRAVAVAMQPTLASAGPSQGVQFHKLQVWHHSFNCIDLFVHILLNLCSHSCA